MSPKALEAARAILIWLWSWEVAWHNRTLIRRINYLRYWSQVHLPSYGRLQISSFDFCTGKFYFTLLLITLKDENLNGFSLYCFGFKWYHMAMGAGIKLMELNSVYEVQLFRGVEPFIRLYGWMKIKISINGVNN